MKPTLLFPLLALALAAGCVTPTPESDPGADNTTMPDGEMGALPEPIEDSQMVPASSTVPDPVGTGATPGPCEAPTETCFRYPFELTSPANITASLTWTVPANDFDLYVFQDGARTDVLSGQAVPGTSESIDGALLAAGSYELVVAAYTTAGDTFAVSATFAH